LSDLLLKTNKKTLANYLAWSAAKTLMTYLNKDARDIKFKFDKGASGIQEASPTWKRCVNEMGFNGFSGGGFGFVAGSMYARRYFKAEAKVAMVEMTSYIRTAFKEDILVNLDWMDATTKKRAETKLEKMDQFIAYSDEFLVKEKVDDLHKTVTVEVDDYLGNTLNLIKFWRRFYYNQLRDKINPKSWLEHSLVSVVNAFYNPGQNNMEFPAGILQGVFFNANVPRYLNYAAIGAVIGHEITHGFDDQGKQRNEIGKFKLLLLFQLQ
jgi:predicted metalloendopeptidase